MYCYKWLVVLSVFVTGVVFAHGDEHSHGQAHYQHVQQVVEHSQEQNSKMTVDQALDIVEQGVAAMHQVLQETDFESFSHDSEIMTSWHKTELEINDALDVLESHAKAEGGLHGKRVRSSSKQLLKKINDFHVALHSGDKQAAADEIKKAEGILQLLKAQFVKQASAVGD